MNPNEKTIQCDQLKPGDVILCVVPGEEAAILQRASHSKYTHAGICYSSTEVVDVTKQGIRKTTIAGLVSQTERSAVFRSREAWIRDRVKALQEFLDDSIHKQTAYDHEGVKTFRQRLKEHQLTLLAKVRAFVTNELEPQPHKKPQYICSELVVVCFIEVGFISSGASLAFQADAYSPGAIGKETYFGFFVGYLKPDPTVQIPDDDEFANARTLSEVEQMERQVSESAPQREAVEVSPPTRHPQPPGEQPEDSPHA